MPFVTEEIWQTARCDASPDALTPAAEGSIALSRYPLPNPAHRDQQAEADMGMVMEITNQIRSWRAQLGLPPQQKISVTIAGDIEKQHVLKQVEYGVKGLARLEKIEYAAANCPTPDKALTATVQGVQVILPLAGAIEDPQAQLTRLQKKMDDLQKNKQRSEGKLGSEKFVANAKPEIVEEERRRLAETEEQMAHLREQMALFEGLL
jgi:valyl-tRNA synthetase